MLANGEEEGGSGGVTMNKLTSCVNFYYGKAMLFFMVLLWNMKKELHSAGDVLCTVTASVGVRVMLSSVCRKFEFKFV